MRKFTLLLVVLLGVSTLASAQLTFSAMKDTLILENGVEQKAEITIYNNEAVDYTVSWSMISSTLMDNDGSGNHWVMQFCECNNCYTNEFSALPIDGTCASPIAAGTSGKWYLTVDPDGQAMVDAEWVIEVNNETAKIKDTLTYVVLAPSSVVEIPNYGRINAFPNPAYNELNIQYALQNVNAPQIEVYNTVGVLVDVVRLNGLQGVVTVNTSDLTPGMYVYMLKNDGATLVSDKFNVVR